MKAKEHKKMIIMCTDGAGAGPDGRGSAFAWVNGESGEKHIERVPGGVANVCATTRESQVSYQSISQQMESATSSRTTGARCQSLHSRQGMQASIRTSLRRERAAASPPELVVREGCSDRMAVRARGRS